MAKRSLNPGTLLCPVPAVMVSCGTGDEKNIITIAWTGIVNSNPPMTYVSVRKSRHSHHLIEESGEFVINVTTEDMAFATDYCGVKSGRDVDKFKEMNLTPIPAEKVSCPMIEESPVNLECKVVEVHSYPSHDMFVAEIVAMHVDEDVFGEDGKMPVESLGLLTYAHGHYMGVKRKAIGRFGYSVMKAKTKKRINREEHEARVEKNRVRREKRAAQSDDSKKTVKNTAGAKKTSASRAANGKNRPAKESRPVKSEKKK